MGCQIGGPRPDPYELALCPDGVYRIQRRVIPVSGDAASGVNNDKSVASVNKSGECRKGIIGAQFGTYVK